MKHYLSRREILILGGFVLGGAVLSACEKSSSVPSLPTQGTTRVPFKPTSEGSIEIETDTVVTIKVGDFETSYIGSGKIELHQNGFYMGKKLMGGHEVYRENGQGPLSNIAFVYSNPELAGFSVTPGIIRITPAIIESYQIPQDARIQGKITIFTLSSGQVTPQSYIVESRILDPGIVLQENAVQINYPMRVDHGVATRIDRLTSILSRGNVDGPIAYLYEAW